MSGLRFAFSTKATHVTKKNEQQRRVAEACSPLHPAESVVVPQADNDEPPAGRGLESRQGGALDVAFLEERRIDKRRRESVSYHILLCCWRCPGI